MTSQFFPLRLFTGIGFGSARCGPLLIFFSGGASMFSSGSPFRFRVVLWPALLFLPFAVDTFLLVGLARRLESLAFAGEEAVGAGLDFFLGGCISLLAVSP